MNKNLHEVKDRLQDYVKDRVLADDAKQELDDIIEILTSEMENEKCQLNNKLKPQLSQPSVN